MKAAWKEIVGLSLILVCLLCGIQETCAKEKVQNPHFPRKALVRNDCLINTIINVVKVGTGNVDQANVVDEDLENYSTVVGVANVGTILDPGIRVKDTKYYYPKDTKAGFCIQAGGSNSVLTLDILENVSIFFYKDNEMIGSAPVDQGQQAGLLDLGLIQIPGGEEGVTFLTATAPGEFDEIGLMQGGVQIEVANTFKIRYAFVGDAQEKTLTTNNISDIKVSTGANSKNIADKDRIIDEDLNNHATQPQILFDFGASVTLSWPTDKMFRKGTEVGFVFKDLGLLNITIGANSSITVRDTRTGLSDEVLLQASVLGLGLITGGTSKVAITAPRDFNEATLNINGLKVALGGREFYYAFICEPTVVPHHKDLVTTMDCYIGSGVTSFEMFASKPSTWKIIGQPAGESASLDVADGATKGESCTISGMTANVNGEYIIEVEAECGCKDTITLMRGNNKHIVSEECRKPISGDTVTLSTEIHESSGSLLSWSNVKNKERITDADMDTYAEYVGGLSLASNLMIAGIKTTDGRLLHDGKSEKKAGFVMEMSSEVLDLNLLQFFQIRLYNKGKKVLEKVIENTNVLSLGLAGQNQMAKVRYGVTVPAGIEFDEMTIWKSGVLTLGLSTIRIYGGYISRVEDRCYEDPLACGSTPINTDSLGAYLNYNYTGFVGVATVGTVMSNLENVLDDDLENTCATIGGVNVGSGWQVSVRLGRLMDRSHQACVVMDNTTYLAVATVAGALNISLYREGVFITDVDNWSVVGVDAIGYGDKQYIFVTPTATYDEIRITNAGLVGLSEGTKIYGVAVRDDVDRNGIPDCLEDPKSLVVFGPSNICLGENVFLSGVGAPNSKYSVESNDLGFVEKTFSTGETGDFLWDLGKPKQAFENALIHIKLSPETEGLEAPDLYITVHPNRTKWTSSTSANNVDWNRWDNWDRGAPWTCTDVVIPAGADRYPDLKEGSLNGCRYIHFEPDAEVVNTHRLTYQKAWVEIDLKPNRYYMVAVPLKETRSGDWFMLRSDAAKPDTFAVWNEGTAPANRIYPTVYQRLWESTTYNRLLSGGRETVYPGETRWTTPANLLAAYYDNADGYALSVWVHHAKPSDNTEGDINKSYTFRFPKEHAVYHYMDPDGNVLDVKEQMRRDPAYIGRFIHEGEDGSTHFPVKQRVRNIGYENKTYLIANPFMAHIDVKEFLKENTHLTSVKVYDGTGNNSLIFATDDAEGLLVAKPGSVAGYPAIAPTQSFFVTTDDQTENEFCEVSFTEAMLTSVPGKGNGLKSTSRALTGVDQASIRLKASVGSAESWALLRFSATAYDAFREAEDAEILIDCGAMPPITLFTLAGEKALDIQQRNRGGQIPLGVYVAEPGGSDVTLSLFLPENCDGWTLEDLDTPRSYPLDGGRENVVRLGKLTTNVGRFYLKGASPTANEGITASPAKVYAYREAGSDRLVVRSSSETMCRCELFNESGKLGGLARFESDEYHLSAVRGVNIIKIYFKDGRSETLKIAHF